MTTSHKNIVILLIQRLEIIVKKSRRYRRINCLEDSISRSNYHNYNYNDHNHLSYRLRHIRI